jgi:hypothetical protein
MRGRRGRGRRWTVVGLTAMAAVVLVVLLAAPAFAADPVETTWSVSPKSDVITYGDALFLSGEIKVKSTGSPIVGLHWVEFGQGTNQSDALEIVYQITTPNGSTKYAVGVKPLRNMFYRFKWAGSAEFAASDSAFIPVQVAPAIGSPVNGTSISVNKKFTVKGSVEPGASGGPAIKIKAYRQKGDGSWTGYKTYSAKVSGTEYSQKIAITQTGKFKFKAVSLDSAKWAAGASGFGKVLTVKAVATL